MSAECVGAMLREAMEPAPARLAATGVMVTAEQAGHYCVPIKLKRLYRERKLGNPFAKRGEKAGEDRFVGLIISETMVGEGDNVIRVSAHSY